MKIRTILILIVVIALLGLGGFAIVKQRGQADKQNKTTVRIATPERGELIETINAPGEVEPKKHVEISAKVSARVVSLPFVEGRRVTRGDPDASPPVPPSVIVKLDSIDLEAILRSTEARRNSLAAQIEVSREQVAAQVAQIAGTQASLDQARLELQRQQALLKSRDVSQSEVDKAQTSVDEKAAQLLSAQKQLQAAKLGLIVEQHNLEAAEADITRAREDLSYTTITAPMDGVITRINAEEGELVMTGTMNNAGTVIMEIADLSRMIVSAQVDERDVAQVKVGQQARVKIHAWPDREFKGVVEKIALTQRMNNSGTKYYETEVLLEDMGERILSGLTADVDIEVSRHENILKVPSQSVLALAVDELPTELRNVAEVNQKKTLATVVYRGLVNEQGILQSTVTPVRTGPSDTTHTIILSGLSDSDRVVVGPYKELEKLAHEQLLQEESAAEQDGPATGEQVARDGQSTQNASAPKDEDS